MRNFQDTFGTRKRSFISAFSIYMTVLLRANSTYIETSQLICITILLTGFYVSEALVLNMLTVAHPF